MKKKNWLPINKPKHQGVDLKDGMGITEDQRRAMQKSIHQDVNKFYKTITPKIVTAKLDKMISQFVTKNNK